jgi:hypothetical protein
MQAVVWVLVFDFCALILGVIEFRKNNGKFGFDLFYSGA